MNKTAGTKGVIVLAAGGTGGHLFPAEALGAELARRGFEPYLITEGRARCFVSYFDEKHIHLVQSATISGKNPYNWLCSLWRLFCGFHQSRRLFKKLKPLFVIGFGGYPTLPPLYAATWLKLPTLIHEENTVMGRANRLLSRYANAISGGFPLPQSRYANKMTVTGNPLREAVVKAAQVPYKPAGEGDIFNLLVFGGSQGASFFSNFLPQALALLDPSQHARLHIIQQARSGEIEELEKNYEDLKISAEIAPFFNNMAQHIAAAHFVISRSGASTVGEIASIGRPALLIPYPGALDHDQAENAKILVATGGAQVKRQQDLTAKTLAELITQALDKPSMLAEMAEMARGAGHLQATEKLADLVETLLIKFERIVP